MSSSSIERIGRYEIRGILGQGAMGIVYRAYDTVLERVVALKTHHASLAANDNIRRRFAAEVKTSCRLNHPNIVTVYDGGIETDIPFIAMELVEGTTLQAALKERGRLPVDEALAILVPVGQALACAHRQQIIHRDLKPANILISTSGQPKVTDFGVAKVLDANGPASTMLVGTPSHMAPEQISGATLDGRADVFALGVVAYETLTGVVPFPGTELPQIIHSVLTKEPPPASEIEPSLPTAVDAVLKRALAKDPGARYPDAESFVADLRAALSRGRAPETIVVAKEVAPSRAAATSGWRVAAWTSTGLAAVAVAAALLFTRVPDEKPAGSFESAARGPAPSGPAPAGGVVPAAPAASGPAGPSGAQSEQARAVESGAPPAEPSTAGAEAPTAAPPSGRQATVAPARKAGRPAPREPRTATSTRPATSGRRASDAAGPAIDTAHPRLVGTERGGGVRFEFPVSHASEKSSLTVQSEPPGAAVRLNGKPSGKAPVELSGLAAGSYEVTVEFPGVPPQNRRVAIAGGGSHHTVTFTLER